MRLTLRTLLAYLDDTLEPAQARMIGQKVAESDAAQELVARIKQVTRRRRLTTPPPTGLDANTTAEYLDNALPGEQLGEVEEKCLASDVHLAEVAACHQILTLVVGEPALVPPTARQRMYSLVKGKESIPNRPPPSMVPVSSPYSNGAITPFDEADEPLLLGLPLYGSGAWLRWLVPVVASCLLVVAGIAIYMAILSKPPAFLGEGIAENRPQHFEQGDGKKPGDAAVVQKPADLPDESQKKEVTAKEESGKQNLAAVDTPKDTVKKPDVATKPNMDDAKTKPEKTTEIKKPDSPAVAEKSNEPSTERRELGKAVLSAQTPAVLLQRSGSTGGWQRLKPLSKIFATDILLSLPGYRSDVRLDSGIQLTLWGNVPQFSKLPPVLESGVTLFSNPAFDLDFTLDRGRVVISNVKEKGPANIRVRFLDQVWDLTLQDKNSEVAVEITGTCQPVGKNGGAPSTRVWFYGLAGQMVARVRYQDHLMVSPCIFDWESTTGAGPGPGSIPRSPDWYTQKTPPQTRESQAMIAALKGMAGRLVSKEVDVVLAETIRDADPTNRELAIRCLAAIELLPGVLEALGYEKSLSVRELAREELLHFLGIAVNADEKLVKAMKQKYASESEARIMVQLLHPPSDEESADPATKGRISGLLMHDRLEIRQLTHSQLLNLVPEGKKISFDPAGPAESRERGFQEWLKLVGNKSPAKTGAPKPKL